MTATTIPPTRPYRKKPLVQALGGVTRFGRLTVLCEVEAKRYRGSSHRQALCRCDCGTEKVATFNQLKTGNTKSCGCYQSDYMRSKMTKHGHTRGASEPGGKRPRSPEYKAWTAMKDRCLNPECRQYKDYGARGVSIHQEWISSFQYFLAHIGRRPEAGWSLDRLDVKGHYEPGNVRWVSSKVQANNKRWTVYIDVAGAPRPLTEYAAEVGVKPATLRARMKRGMSAEQAVAWPRGRRLGEFRSAGAGRKVMRHGLCGTPEYAAWRSAKTRCYSVSHSGYKDYGARGITMSPLWINDFAAFLAYVGERPSSEHSLDRIDPNGHYEPGNVRWATRQQQQANRRNSRLINWNGKIVPATVVAEALGVKAITAWQWSREGKHPDLRPA